MAVSVLCLFLAVPWDGLDGEERVGFFALTVFLMSCDIQCSVALPRECRGLVCSV